MFCKLYFTIGCKDRLPIKMNTDKNCKRLNKTCSNLKYVCYLRLGSAIGISDYAYKCRYALGYRKNKKVEDFCKKSCHKCGKFI